MNKRSSKRALSAIATALTIVLLPLQSSPARATTASPKPITPDKLKAMPSDKPSAQKPEIPKGSFASPPPLGGKGSQNATPGDHFRPGVSQLVDRSELADIFDNGDGTNTMQLHGAAKNFKNAKGQWEAIDSKLQRGVDGRLHNVAGPVAISLAQSTGSGSLGTLSDGTHSISFDLEGVALAKQAARQDNSATYVDALSNTDLHYEVAGTTLKESIIVNSQTTGETKYRFPITVQGVHGTTSAEDGIAFVDDNDAGNAVFRVRKGIAWDAKGKQGQVEVTLAADGKAIDVSPDAAFMQSASYPVTIDPTIDAGRASGHWDAFASSASPTTNFNGNNQIDNNAYVDKVGYASFPSSDFNSYMSYDLSSIMGKQILSGQLHFYTYSYVKPNPDATLFFWPVNYGWTDNTVTWNNRPSHRSDDWITSDPAVNAWTTLDMTTWVGNWASGAWTSQGVAVDTAGENAYARNWAA